MMTTLLASNALVLDRFYYNHLPNEPLAVSSLDNNIIVGPVQVHFFVRVWYLGLLGYSNHICKIAPGFVYCVAKPIGLDNLLTSFPVSWYYHI